MRRAVHVVPVEVDIQLELLDNVVEKPATGNGQCISICTDSVSIDLGPYSGRMCFSHWLIVYFAP